MATPISIEWTPKGLLIPRTELEGWDEIEVLRENERIVIQPREAPASPTREMVIAALRQAGLVMPIATEPPLDVVSPEERARLARKAGAACSLSGAVLDERQKTW